MSANNRSKSVLKLDLLKKLWESGHKPPIKWDSVYDRKASEFLYQLLGLDKKECSNATIDNIEKEVTSFQKSVLYAWQKCGRKRPAMEKRDVFMQSITIDFVSALHELSPPPVKASGAYKAYEDKKSRAQSYASAEVLEQHEPAAILDAAPRAAKALGHPELATALRQLNADRDVRPGLAIEGMKNECMYARKSSGKKNYMNFWHLYIV